MQYKRNKNKNNISKYIIFLNKIFLLQNYHISNKYILRLFAKYKYFL